MQHKLFKNDMSSAAAAQSAHGHIGTAVRMRFPGIAAVSGFLLNETSFF
jgi:hypothetical protein